MMRSFTTSVIVALALFLRATRSSLAFPLSRSGVATHHHVLKSVANRRQAAPFTSRMAYSDDNSNNKPEYSRELMLREEAESPFRKVRFFLYLSLGAGALTSLLISLARIAAASFANVNTDLLPESLTNAGIDIAGIVVLSFLYQRDLRAQESRLKRASKGAELAKLKVYASKGIVQDIDSDEILSGAEVGDTATFVTSLASLRQGRGIEKRVVIVAGGKSKIEQVLKQAKDLDSDLELNDLLIVPIILPQLMNFLRALHCPLQDYQLVVGIPLLKMKQKKLWTKASM
jgi:Low psii accumulation1 / Rep27